MMVMMAPSFSMCGAAGACMSMCTCVSSSVEAK